MNGTTAPVLIEVGTLELVGFPEARRFAIASAFESAFTRLVQERGLPPTLAQHGSVATEDRRAPPVRLDPDGHPALLGQAIAHAVYEGLG